MCHVLTTSIIILLGGLGCNDQFTNQDMHVVTIVVYRYRQTNQSSLLVWASSHLTH